jgi:hypothetical protein
MSWTDKDGKTWVQAPGEVWSNTDFRLSDGHAIIPASISKKIRMSSLLKDLRGDFLKSPFEFKVRGFRKDILVFESREKALEAKSWIHQSNQHRYGIEAHLFDGRKLRIVITGDYVIGGEPEPNTPEISAKEMEVT